MKEQHSGVKWFNTIFYPQNKTGRAVRYEDGVLPRLREDIVTIFVPWGPRYSYKTRGVSIANDDKEMKVLTFLRGILDEFRGNMPQTNFQWVFLGADLYGTRVNGLPKIVVSDYFESLRSRIQEVMPQAVFYLWSEFNESAEEYRKRASKELDDIISPKIQSRAVATARKMGTGGDAREYLVERVAEAMLIEEKFSPIKISCVPRHKDDGVDFRLPRLYLVPEELHAPWL